MASAPSRPAGRGTGCGSPRRRSSLRDVGPLPTDDWPFLYLRDGQIPWAPTGQGMP